METIPTNNPSKEERIWATIVHLSAFSIYLTGIGYLLGPLVVWLLKREGHPFLDDQGKEALNFQITTTIAALISIVLIFVAVGIALLIAVCLASLVFTIIAAIKANNGETYRYPFTLRLIK